VPGVYLLRLGVLDGKDTDFDQVMVTVQPPPPPVITRLQEDNGPSQLDGITNDNTPTLSGTAATGAVTLHQNGTPVAAVLVSGGAWSYTSVVLPDGVYTFTATGMNAPGQESSPSAAKNVMVDTTLAEPEVNQVGSCNGLKVKTPGLVPPKCDASQEINGKEGHGCLRLCNPDEFPKGCPPDHVTPVHVEFRDGNKVSLPHSPYGVKHDCSNGVLQIDIRDKLAADLIYDLTFIVSDVAGNKSSDDNKSFTIGEELD